jgi:hypothetical protein
LNGTEDSLPAGLVGLVRVRDHCVFTWRAPAIDAAKKVEIEPGHCGDCIAELRNLGYVVKPDRKQDL